MIAAYIGLGGNLGEPEAHLRAAFDALAALPDSHLAAVSSLYRSRAIGPGEQPDYLNAAARLDTLLAPEALLDALQAIEHAAGRERLLRWGARTLDLDLLLYGDQVIASERLSVPHPHLPERNFVLQPLLEIAPALCLPDGRPLRPLAEASGWDGLERLAAFPSAARR